MTWNVFALKRGLPGWLHWSARAVSPCIWLYLAAVAAVWLLLRLGGDRWWFATLILFGPRWLFALPLAVLGPLALLGLRAGLVRRRMVVPMAAAALVVFGPIMGFCLPWARLTASNGAASKRPTIRVLTCNLKGHCQDNQALDELIRDTEPDIVALQGCWHAVRMNWPEGWHAFQQDELLIASRYPLREVASAAEGNRPEKRGPEPFVRSTRRAVPAKGSRPLFLLTCVITAPGGEIRFSTLHPPSPHHSFDKMLDRRTILRPSQSGQLAQEIEDRWQDAEQTTESLEGDGQSRVIAGDFNLPPDSAIYRKFWAGYHNAFGEAGVGYGYTEWPRMRKMRFGIRIDHILTTSDWRPLRCWLGPDVGSDHLPLIADLAWTPSAEPQ